MPDNDGIATLATGLNEDAKAARRKPKQGALDSAKAHLGTDEGEGQDENLTAAVEKLGDALFDQRALDIDEEGRGPRERNFSARLDHLAAIADDSMPEGRALVRFAFDFMLEQIKHRPRPWDDMLEEEQRDLGSAVQENAKELVRKIVEAVRADGAPTAIRALLESYSEKDGIKATLKIKPASEEDALSAVVGLHKAQGKHVLITVASADDFNEEPPRVTVQPDQHGLGFEAGTDEHPDDDSDLAGGAED